MASVLRLQILLRIPIGIIKDTNIRRLEVNAESTRSRGQNEDKLFASWSIELINGRLAVFISRVAINAAVLVTAHHHEILHDIKHSCHLRENEYTVALLE